jgi:hypothetical protein
MATETTLQLVPRCPVAVPLVAQMSILARLLLIEAPPAQHGVGATLSQFISNLAHGTLRAHSSGRHRICCSSTPDSRAHHADLRGRPMVGGGSPWVCTRGLVRTSLLA